MKGTQYSNMLNEDESFKFRFNFFRHRLSDVVHESEWREHIEGYYESFGEFISLGFVFATTPEGYDYWDKIRLSERDGVKYRRADLKINSLLTRPNPNIETLDDVLNELNIKKEESTMTKLQLDLNPFLCTIDVSAKINGVEERCQVGYVPLNYPDMTYASLGDKVFCIVVDYTDSLLVSVTDESDDSVQPFKLRVTK
jgi:hypothetical protein